VIEPKDLPTHVIDGTDQGLLPTSAEAQDDGPWEPMPLADAMRGPERRILLRALEANGWNRQQTADQLDINRTTLYKKMKTYGLDDSGRRAG